jgi:putative transposase
MEEGLKPRNHQEAVAVFRHGIIGALTQAQLEAGQLRAALEALAAQRFVPPRAKVSRSFSVSTLERWYYALKKRGLAGLSPRPRSHKGRAQELSQQQRALTQSLIHTHDVFKSALLFPQRQARPPSRSPA